MVLTKKIAIKTVTGESLVLGDIQALLPIANVLPADVDAPDWRTPEPPGDPGRPEHPAVAMAKARLAQLGMDLEKSDAKRFRAFLDERFPRDRFAAFRDMVDGPDLARLVARREGWQTAPSSPLSNYQFIVKTRRTLRGAAEILAQIAAESGKERPALRFCEFCDSVFIARRKDKVWCKDKCGSVIRMRRKRDRMRRKRAKYRQYEDARKRKHGKQRGVAR